MRPVNLIPPEDRRGERAPMRAGFLAYVVVAALLLLFVGVYALTSTGNSISEREAEIAGLQQQLESSRARADALQAFSSFAALEQNRTLTVATLARSRFDWERVMRELALVIPDDVSLTALSGSAGAESGPEPGSTAGTSAGGGAAPTLEISGCSKGHEGVAGLLAALRDIDGVTRVGLSSSSAGTADGAATSGASSGAGCPDPNAATFEITAVFDAVEAPVAGDSGASPAPAEPGPDSETDAAQAANERADAEDSASSAEGRSREAVDRYVPGA